MPPAGRFHPREKMRCLSSWPGQNQYSWKGLGGHISWVCTQALRCPESKSDPSMSPVQRQEEGQNQPSRTVCELSTLTLLLSCHSVLTRLPPLQVGPAVLLSPCAGPLVCSPHPHAAPKALWWGETLCIHCSGCQLY